MAKKSSKKKIDSYEAATSAASLLKSIEEDCGKGCAICMSGGTIRNVPHIKSGIPQLDAALGIGGIPKGRIVEIYGPESSGKTTVCLKVLGSLQRETNGIIGIVDVEHSLDPVWAAKQGLDMSKVVLSQPDSGEMGLSIARSMIKRGAVGVMVDSIAALVPQVELEGNLTDACIGVQARMMSKAMRLMVSEVHRAGTVAMFTNQMREKIGVMFGSPETTSGGKAMRFAASIRLDIRRTGSEKESSAAGADATANTIKIKVVKNKLAPPFKVCNAVISFKKGLDTAVNLFYALLNSGYITKKGKSFTFNDESLSTNGIKKALKTFIKMMEVDEELKSTYDAYLEAILNPDEDDQNGDEEDSEEEEDDDAEG